METIVDPAIAFRVPPHEEPAVEVRVNFGMYAGRNASPAETDDLARALREEASRFVISIDERHEFGNDRETAVRQVVIEVERDDAGGDPDGLAERVVAIAETWAAACIEARSDLGELSD
jgi:alkanesulfonate monooxygenase SsuD/methylene tetrahydromethanopterin reductase-like flavin-dependent oxidoreductase (luciferase family)